jgi:hypothetical protein
MLLCLIFGSALQADAFTLKVKDDTGNPVNKYRWMVEEDTTNVVTPGTFSPNTLGVNIHTTYAPVKKRGHANSSSTVIDVPTNKRWLVSVLPDAAADGSLKFTAGGHLVEKGAENVKVVVNSVQSTGVPTAQISIFIFNDNAPINNTPDIGEPGLGDVSILLFDQAGAVSQDAFGNPLGTDYQRNSDGTFQFNADGSPVIKTPGSAEIVTCQQPEVDAFSPGRPLFRSTIPRGRESAGQSGKRRSTIPPASMVCAQFLLLIRTGYRPQPLKGPRASTHG